MTQEWLDYLKDLAAYQVALLEWLSGGNGGVHTDSGDNSPRPKPPIPPQDSE